MSVEKMGISAVIITKDEEVNIARCILSVKNITDEVIVIDSNSTDKTVEIAESLGAKVYQKEWLGYGPQKNFGANQASFPYILSIDADEALDEDLKSEILSLKNSLNGCYEVKRLTNYCGKFIYHSGWYPDKKIRIYPKNEVYWDNQLVHEKLIFPKKYPINSLRGNLLHYSFYSVADHWDRINKYSNLEAEIINRKKDKFLVIKMIFSPFFKFIKIYFFKKGFLDGKEGFIIAKLSAYGVFLKYAKSLFFK